MISELGSKCQDALNLPKATLEKAMTTYNALLVEVQNKANATNVGRLALERMPDLSFLVDHRALEGLSGMIDKIDEAAAKVSSASVGFFRSEKNITRALEKLTAMKQICAALENLFEKNTTANGQQPAC